MKSFFEQLATQSGLDTAGKVPVIMPEEVSSLEGGIDIVEVEADAESLPPEISVQAESVPVESTSVPESAQPPSVEMTSSEEVVESEPVIIEKSVFEAGEPEPVDDLPMEVPEVDAVAEEQSEEVHSEPLISELEAPAAAAFDEVFAWIAAGENQQPVESDASPTDVSPAEVPAAIEELISQDIDVPVTEPPKAELAKESTPAVLSIPARRAEETDFSDPFSATSPPAAEKAPRAKPTIPSVTIGSIQVTVDAGTPPEPVRPQAVVPAPVAPPRSSSRTQLRRHYIIPH